MFSRCFIGIFVVVAGISFAMPALSLGAAGFVSRSGSIRSPRNPPLHVFPRRFQSLGFFGLGNGVIDEPPSVIIIQQFQPAPANQPRERAQEKVYIQPRWVDGGHGVQVLEPGYWTVLKQTAEP